MYLVYIKTKYIMHPMNLKNTFLFINVTGENKYLLAFSYYTYIL